MTSEDPPRKRERRRAGLLLLIFFLVGGPGLGTAVLTSWQGVRHRSTPIRGVISSVGAPQALLQQNTLYDTSPPEIECDYQARFTVGGAAYVARGTLINQSRYQLTPEPKCQYSVGDPITVFYDPSNPSVSTLGLRPLTSMTYLGVLSAVFTGVGLLVLIRFVRRSRAG